MPSVFPSLLSVFPSLLSVPAKLSLLSFEERIEDRFLALVLRWPRLAGNECGLHRGEFVRQLNRQHSWQFAIAKRFSTGTDLSLELSTDRVTSRSADAVAPLNYGGRATIRMQQPILRGFSFDLEVPRIEILRAKLAAERQTEQVRSALVDVIQDTEQAYRRLVQALKAYEVRRDSAVLAEKQMTLTRRKIWAGVLAPAEEIEVESTLAQRAFELIQAKRDVDAASDVLRRVINLPWSEWSRPVVATDVPAFEETRVEVQEALETALQNRPEARQVELDLKSAGYDLRAALNDRLPDMDLDLSYALSGQDVDFGGTVRARASRSSAVR